MSQNRFDPAFISVEESLDLTVPSARKSFEELERWLGSADALGLAEHVVEEELGRRGREVWRLLLQRYLDARGTGDVGPEIEVVGADERVWRHHAQRIDPRKVVSIFGEVTVRRTAYVAAGRVSVHPLDAALALPQRSFSYALQRRVVEEAVRGPFEEVCESLERQTGKVLSKRSAEQITVDAAEDFEAFYAQRGAPPAEATGPILVGAIDCKGVPLVKAERAAFPVRRRKGQKAQKKKMATVAAVFTQAPRVRTPEQVVESLFADPRPAGSARERPEHKRVWASLRKSKDEVFTEVAAEMAARDPQGCKQRVVVTDGERALQRRAQRWLPGVVLILDLLHGLEALWEAAYALYAEGSDEATGWVRKQALRILRGQVSQTVKGMRQSATKRQLQGSPREALLKAAGYLYRNRAYMRYDEYLAHGWPIASGAVEGACKNLVKDRMERSGMRWQIPGAEAMLRLRAIKLSGDMDDYWLFHIQQEQARLYGQIQWRLA